jgi:hypothetical protein
LIGLLFGFLILTVATYTFVLAVFLAWIIFRDGRKNLKWALTVAAVTALVLTPWIIRNRIVLGAPVFVSANSGLMLLQGNSENSAPNSGPTADISKYIIAASPMGEAQRDAYYRSVAVHYILTHPVRSLKLYALKTLNYFNYRNNLYTVSESSSMRDLVSLLTYAPLLALFILRITLHRRRPLTPFESFAVLLYLLNGVFSAIFYTRLRYRAPFDLLPICVVALLIAKWFSTSERSGCGES